jgi:hypothetical protein
MIRLRALMAGYPNSDNNDDGEFPNNCDYNNKDEGKINMAGRPGGRSGASGVVVINDDVTIIAGCRQEGIGTRRGKAARDWSYDVQGRRQGGSPNDKDDDDDGGNNGNNWGHC